MSKNPEGNYVDVPQSVVDYIQAYVGGHNNGVVGNWDGALMLDSVKNRVLLIGNQLPMDITFDWMEPYCWRLHKVMKVITETIVPATEIMREKQRIAKEHLFLWTLEAEHRKGCLVWDPGRRTVSKLGVNQTLLGWLLAGEVEMVLEEIGFNSYFTQHEIDKIKVLMQRVNNQEQLHRLRTDGVGKGV